MGFYEFVHNAYVHPVLNPLLCGIFDITPFETDTKNVDFIARLRTDPGLRSRVAVTLTMFYGTILNAQTAPPIPPNAYLRGIEESFQSLTP